MSGYMIAEVWCDLCGERVVAEDEGTLREHRADLRDAGWRRKQPVTEAELNAWDEGNGSPLLDVCPDCQEEQP